jgi:translation initiation factor IF-1
MTDPPIRAIGVIQERISHELYRITLPNGKDLLGHLSKELKQAQVEFLEDAKVHLELTPYDFDTGRIAGLVED